MYVVCECVCYSKISFVLRKLCFLGFKQRYNRKCVYNLQDSLNPIALEVPGQEVNS